MINIWYKLNLRVKLKININILININLRLIFKLPLKNMHTDHNMSSSPQNIYNIQITEFIIINDSIYIRIYLNIYKCLDFKFN